MRARIAVAGATGYIGTRLVPALAGAGYNVRCFVRSPRKLRDRPWVSQGHIEVVRTDLDDEALVASQLRGCNAAFYLVHSVESAGRDAAHDRAMAHRFAEAASHAGVERIVFLGSLGEASDGLNEQFASRQVEHVLRAGSVPVTVFRAAMILGSGSPSFEILRHLAERLPVMIAPRWVRSECQPISVRDVLHYLVACLDHSETVGRTLEIGGADVLSYQELLQTMAEERGLLPRLIIPVPVLSPVLSALWIQLVTPVSARTARPLIQAMRNRLTVEDHETEWLMPQRLLGARDAIRLALKAEPRADVPISRDAGEAAAAPVPLTPRPASLSLVPKP